MRVGERCSASSGPGRAVGALGMGFLFRGGGSVLLPVRFPRRRRGMYGPTPPGRQGMPWRLREMQAGAPMRRGSLSFKKVTVQVIHIEDNYPNGCGFADFVSPPCFFPLY